jgi:sugar-specific transcriptional regulator TrmB
MSEKAIEALENLGFSTYEARAYLGLLQKNPVSGYQLSKATGIPRSRIYETLERLMVKGLAVSFQEEPVVYAPLAADALQSQLKETFNNNLSALEEELERLAAGGEPEILWNIRGQEAILTRARGMIARATRAVYLVAWAGTLEMLRKELETADNRGLRVIIISCGDIEGMPGTYYCHAFEEAIVRIGSGSINLVVDSQEVLTGAVLGSEGGTAEACVAVWSRNKGLVFTTEEYIRHEVYLHKVIERFAETESDALQAALTAGLKEIPYE